MFNGLSPKEAGRILLRLSGRLQVDKEELDIPKVKCQIMTSHEICRFAKWLEVNGKEEDCQRHTMTS